MKTRLGRFAYHSFGIVVSVLVATLGTFFYIEHDEWFRSLVKDQLVHWLARQYHAQVSFDLAYISIIQGHLVLRDVCFSDSKEEGLWRWRAPRIDMYGQYRFVWSRKKVGLSLHIPRMYSASVCKDASCAMGEHVAQLFGPIDPQAPCFLYGLHIGRCVLRLMQKDYHMTFEGVLSCLVHNRSRKNYLTCTIKEGALCCLGYSSPVVKDLSVEVGLTQDKKLAVSKLSARISGEIVPLGRQQGTFVAQLEREDFERTASRGIFSLSNQARSCLVEAALQNNRWKGSVKGTHELPLEAGMARLPQKSEVFTSEFEYNPHLHDLQCDIHTKGTQLDSPLNLGATRAHTHLTWGTGGLVIEGDQSVVIRWGSSTLELKGTSSYRQGGMRIYCSLDKLYRIEVEYLASAQPQCTSILYRERQQVASLTCKHKGQFEARAKAELLRSLGGLFTHLTYEGWVKCQGSYLPDDQGRCLFTLESEADFSATSDYGYQCKDIRLACSLDPIKGLLVITKGAAHLYEGKLDIPYAYLWYDPTALVPRWACVRVAWKDLKLFGIPDVLARLHGYSALRYDAAAAQNNMHALGYVVVDGGYVRTNIFAQDFAASLKRAEARSGQPKNVSIKAVWDTLKPIRVKTDLLDVLVGSKGKCMWGAWRDSAQDQSKKSLEGEVSVKGSLIFPYKPLFIERGTITLGLGAQDMVLDMVARNAIQNYDVSLIISGTFADPHIELVSYPSLAEHQIMTLLYSGSDTGSLYAMVPQALVSSLRKLIFGSRYENSQLYQRLHALFRPLQNVRIVPRIQERTDKLGMRGSLSVEVGDRLKATIEKNFTTADDMAYSLEYALSDQATIKGFADEYGDYGVEVGALWERY